MIENRIVKFSSFIIDDVCTISLAILIQPLPDKQDTFKNDKTRKFSHQIQFTYFQSLKKVRKRAKIRNRCNQAPYLTQDTHHKTNWWGLKDFDCQI